MTTRTTAEAEHRRAGVVGSPVDHSLSPVLHRAAYQALGLRGWTYERAEVRAGELTAYVSTRSRDWVGLSVTMPGKEEALALADEAGEEAELVGAANTLLRTEGGWRAENTDVVGLETALREAGAPIGVPALVVGSGATARSALVALGRLGATEVTLQVRARAREETLRLGSVLGMSLRVVTDGEGIGQEPRQGVLVSTVPPGGRTSALPDRDLSGVVALDVRYDPWPTAWATGLAARGAHVVDGLTMLLHQAARQVELMTGRAAPLEQMRRALEHRGRDT
ncbi:shikimate dehydrogenase [Ornithinimicrobium sediminis]|uniref:shikimate dehydrogenase n=1 Tax=Ornithinimicrobium sediminis TaxID=2904603 RepID=UPI001E48B91C|nr:shikimate dehydrogenase [Ornithinimicrobium sediminis]